MRAVVFVVYPHVFAAAPALVGIAGVGRVTEVHHAQRLGASVMELIQVCEKTPRQHFGEEGLNPGIVGSIPLHGKRRSIGQLKLQAAPAQRIQRRIRPVEMELHAVGLGHPLQDRRRWFSGGIEPAGDTLCVAVQLFGEVLMGLVDGETETALCIAPVAPEIAVIGVDKMLIRLIEHRIRVQGLREFTVALLDGGSIPAFSQGKLWIGSSVLAAAKSRLRPCKVTCCLSSVCRN